MPTYNLLVVFDEIDPDARRAAEILDQCNDCMVSLRYHREDIVYFGWSVVFLAPPPAPATLHRALYEADAVGVFATHRPHIRPPALIWVAGATLVEATDKALGFRPTPVPVSPR
ncbi:hypothetical protein [Paracoccus sp. SSK6]|uniref:hypothetical protein n=1 Tax=Paracoccus sp. SSK6 TaxID=3143131 RepID=UPI00321ADDB8